jgi:hypothetical protein
MLAPSIICAALLGLAQHAFSHPVVLSAAENSLTERAIEKRAPQGPKIGGADFPGMATTAQIQCM